jgi:hypothetical protein
MVYATVQIELEGGKESSAEEANLLVIPVPLDQHNLEVNIPKHMGQQHLQLGILQAVF